MCREGAMTDYYYLTEARWALIASHAPGKDGDPGCHGRFQSLHRSRLPKGARKQLKIAEARTERAETTQRGAEASVRKLAAELARLRSDFETTQRQLAKQSEN